MTMRMNVFENECWNLGVETMKNAFKGWKTYVVVLAGPKI